MGVQSADVKGWMSTNRALADRPWVSIMGTEAKGLRVLGGLVQIKATRIGVFSNHVG